MVDFVKDWKIDASRRDLTINAMSLSLDGQLYDYFDGERHLAEKKIVFVGDTRTRIMEDYLRILRYFRFYGRIALSADMHDTDTLEAIRELGEGLKGISVERVWSEFQKILLGNHSPSLVVLMHHLGVARHIGRCVTSKLCAICLTFESIYTSCAISSTCPPSQTPSCPLSPNLRIIKAIIYLSFPPQVLPIDAGGHWNVSEA